MECENLLKIISQFLSENSAAVAACLLRGFGLDFTSDGILLYTSSGSVQFYVAEVCNGMKSVCIMACFALAYGIVIHKNATRVFVLAVLSMALMLAANVLRIFVLCCFALCCGQELASSFVHDIPGLVLFYAVMMLVFRLCDKSFSKGQTPRG